MDDTFFWHYKHVFISTYIIIQNHLLFPDKVTQVANKRYQKNKEPKVDVTPEHRHNTIILGKDIHRDSRANVWDHRKINKPNQHRSRNSNHCIFCPNTKKSHMSQCKKVSSINTYSVIRAPFHKIHPKTAVKTAVPTHHWPPTQALWKTPSVLRAPTPMKKRTSEWKTALKNQPQNFFWLKNSLLCPSMYICGYLSSILADTYWSKIPMHKGGKKVKMTLKHDIVQDSYRVDPENPL